MISRAHSKSIGYMVNKYIKPTFEGRNIRTLTPDYFDEWKSTLVADEVPPHQINSARQIVNVDLNYLKSLRRIYWNPLNAVKPYKDVKGRHGTLPVDDFRALIDLGGLCGMRLGEIRDLR